jgi:16S rRNA (guanine966-N2)-methyltransferase
MHKKEENKFPKKFNIVEEKTYGISKILFGSYL